jgi:Tol biopolymer transport system component
VWAWVLIGAAVATAPLFPPAADAAFPGRDGLIAFTRADGSEPTEIYVIRPNGQGLRQLTHRRHDAYHSAWSPDGRRIAFTSQVYGVGPNVFVKHLGGGVRRVTRGPHDYWYPTWSPDGRWIAAVRMRWDWPELYEGLVVMRADGTRERVLLESDWMGFRNPAWSPDGQSIAFEGTGVDFNGADPGLYIISPRGGAARRIANVGGAQDAPDWSPDGRLIAYEWGDVLGPDDIRLVRPDDTGHARITDDPLVSDSGPAWAPSGRRLAITRPGGIWTLRPDGSGLRRLTQGPEGVSNYDPSWQPLPAPKRRGRQR